MREIANTPLSRYEIQDKLDYLINEYETYLKRHGFDLQYNVFKEAIITTAEIAENILKVNFSTVAKTLLSVGNHKIKLMDIKENAPGREVGLFHQVKNQIQYG